MRKADKYPLIDPRSPDLYRRILDAAEQLRRQRRAEHEFGLMLQRQREAAARIAVMAMEEAEPVIWVSGNN